MNPLPLLSSRLLSLLFALPAFAFADPPPSAPPASSGPPILDAPGPGYRKSAAALVPYLAPEDPPPAGLPPVFDRIRLLDSNSAPPAVLSDEDLAGTALPDGAAEFPAYQYLELQIPPDINYVDMSTPPAAAAKASIPRRPVVIIPSGSEDPARTAEITDDLRTMMWVLEKAVFGAPASRPDRPVSLWPLSSIAGGDLPLPPVEALWTGESGVIFVIRVPWLLKEQPPAPADGAPSSAWEQARREVLGNGAPASAGNNAPWEPDKVNALRSVIAQALPGAANIRGLQPGQAVIIHSESAAPASGDAGRITARAKKADIDRWAVVLASSKPEEQAAARKEIEAAISGAAPAAPAVRAKDNLDNTNAARPENQPPAAAPPPAGTPATPENSGAAPRPGELPEGPAEKLPVGKAVPGKRGFVWSPYAPDKGFVDVEGLKSGTKVKCPYTNRTFRVP